MGLTRARCSLIVIGCARALERDDHWGALLLHCKTTRCMFDVEEPFEEFLEQVVTGQVTPLQPSMTEMRKARKRTVGFVPQAEPAAPG